MSAKTAENQDYDENYRLIKEILPEIEGELRRDLSVTLREEYEREYERRLKDNEEQINKELEEIIENIKKDIFENYEVKCQTLLKRERDLENSLLNEQKLEAEIKKKLQKEFDSEKEDLVKKVVKEIEAKKAEREANSDEAKRLKERLKLEFNEQMHTELDKKEKLLKLNYQRKLDDGKKNIQEKLDDEWKQKIEKEKKSILSEKEGLLAVKAAEQNKLKKLDEERKGRRKLLADREENLKQKVDSLRNKTLELSSRIKERRSPSFSKEICLTKSSQENVPDKREEPQLLLNKKTELSPYPESKSPSNLGDKLFQFADENTKNLAENVLFEITKSAKKCPSKNVPFSNIDLLPPPTFSSERNNLDGPFSPLSGTLLSVSKSPEHKFTIPTSDPKKLQDITNDRKRFISSPKGTSNPASQSINKYTIPQYNSKSLAEEILKQYRGNIINDEVFNEEKLGGTSSKSRSKENNHSREDEKSGDYNDKGISNYGLNANESNKFTLNKENEYDPDQLRQSFKGKTQYKSFIGDSKKEDRQSIVSKEFYQKRRIENGLSSIIGEDLVIINNQIENNRSFISDDCCKQKSNKTKGMTKALTKYDKLFEKNSDDKDIVLKMKALKREIERKYEADAVAEEKFRAIQAYFKIEFPKKMQYFNLETRRHVEDLVDSLLVSWEENAISYPERVEFISSLEDLKNDTETLKKKIGLEIDYLRVYLKACGDLIEKLRQRDNFRKRINKEEFNLKTHRKIYSTIRQIDSEINNLLKIYSDKHKRKFYWKAVEVRELIECDVWEEDYLEKQDLREEILNKYRRKI